MKVRVNQRGQLSLPREVRQHLRLGDAGGTLELRVVDGGVQIVVPRARHPFLAMAGTFTFDGVLDDTTIADAIVRGATRGEGG